MPAEPYLVLRTALDSSLTHWMLFNLESIQFLFWMPTSVVFYVYQGWPSDYHAWILHWYSNYCPWTCLSSVRGFLERHLHLCGLPTGRRSSVDTLEYVAPLFLLLCLSLHALRALLHRLCCLSLSRDHSRSRKTTGPSWQMLSWGLVWYPSRCLLTFDRPFCSGNHPLSHYLHQAGHPRRPLGYPPSSYSWFQCTQSLHTWGWRSQYWRSCCSPSSAWFGASLLKLQAWGPKWFAGRSSLRHRYLSLQLANETWSQSHHAVHQCRLSWSLFLH